jgi:Protein of unknown function (DUF4013)
MITGLEGWSGSGVNPLMRMTPFMMIFLMYPMLALMMLFSIATRLFLPPALMQMIAKDSFCAAFKFLAWWKIFRANIGGYVIAFLMSFSIFLLLYYATIITFFSIILCFLAPILVGVMVMYSGLVSSALFGQAYRTGVERPIGTGTTLTQVARVSSPQKPSDIALKPKWSPRTAAVKNKK